MDVLPFGKRFELFKHLFPHELNMRQRRLLELLASYDLGIEYASGKENKVVDVLS